MAHAVKLEPGDVLVLSVGDALASLELEDLERFGDELTRLKERLGLAGILLFEGDVDLSKLPPGWTPPEAEDTEQARLREKQKTEIVLARLREGIGPDFDGRF